MDYFHFFLQCDWSMSLPAIAPLNKLSLPNGEDEDDYKKPMKTKRSLW